MKSKLSFLKEYGILGLVSLLACSLFLGFSFRTAGLGFPLDDAWIHQAFARNFSESLTWSFQLGTASGGSTGPLWGFVLSLLYFFGIPEVVGRFRPAILYSSDFRTRSQDPHRSMGN